MTTTSWAEDFKKCIHDNFQFATSLILYPEECLHHGAPGPYSEHPPYMNRLLNKSLYFNISDNDKFEIVYRGIHECRKNDADLTLRDCTQDLISIANTSPELNNPESKLFFWLSLCLLPDKGLDHQDKSSSSFQKECENLLKTQVLNQDPSATSYRLRSVCEPLGLGKLCDFLSMEALSVTNVCKFQSLNEAKEWVSLHLKNLFCENLATWQCRFDSTAKDNKERFLICKQKVFMSPQDVPFQFTLSFDQLMKMQKTQSLEYHPSITDCDYFKEGWVFHSMPMTETISRKNLNDPLVNPPKQLYLQLGSEKFFIKQE